MPLANASLTANGVMHYGDQTRMAAIQALDRVRSILEKVEPTGDVKESIDLNSYMRVELVRLAALRIEIRAAMARSSSEFLMASLTEQREVQKFLSLGD